MVLEHVAQKSRLKDLDPLVKLGASLFTIFLLVGLRPPLLMGGLLFLVVSFFAFFETQGLGPFLDLLKGPLVFILMGLLGILVDFSRIPLGLYNLPLGSFYLVISQESILRAREIFLLSLSSVSLLLVYGATTPLGDSLGALRRLHLPELFIEIMYLTYRYIFLILTSYHQLNQAAQARLGYRGLKRTLGTLGLVASRLLNGSLAMAFRSLEAMESRLYDGQLIFLESDFNRKKSRVFLTLWALFVGACLLGGSYL